MSLATEPEWDIYVGGRRETVQPLTLAVALEEALRIRTTTAEPVVVESTCGQHRVELVGEKR